MFCVDERCLALDELLTHPIRAAHMPFHPLRLLSTVLHDAGDGPSEDGGHNQLRLYWIRALGR